MKYFLLLILGGLYFEAGAQDYCSKVKKQVTNQTMFSYESPYDTTTVPVIKISRSFSSDPQLEFDNFSMSFSIYSDLQEFFKKNPDGAGENELRKFTIEFDDKSKLVEDSITVVYEQNNDVQLMLRTYTMDLNVKKSNTLSSKKIAKFTISNVERTIPADSAAAYMGYFKCIKDTHKVEDKVVEKNPDEGW